MPWSMPHSSPVAGSKPKPMVLRSPLAKIDEVLPSGATCIMVAFRGSGSLQALQVDPTET